MNETPRVSLQKRFERNYPLLWTNLSRLNGLAIDLNKFSPNEKKVEISSIFKWFKQDFKSTRSKLTFPGSSVGPLFVWGYVAAKHATGQ